jgi:hypothetical protein
MAMCEREIRERLSAVLSGDLSLAAFGEWLASVSWNMFADNSSGRAIDLVAAVNIRIDAYNDGSLDAAAFHRELAALIDTISASPGVPCDSG